MTGRVVMGVWGLRSNYQCTIHYFSSLLIPSQVIFHLKESFTLETIVIEPCSKVVLSPVVQDRQPRFIWTTKYFILCILSSIVELVSTICTVIKVITFSGSLLLLVLYLDTFCLSTLQNEHSLRGCPNISIEENKCFFFSFMNHRIRSYKVTV